MAIHSVSIDFRWLQLSIFRYTYMILSGFYEYQIMFVEWLNWLLGLLGRHMAWRPHNFLIAYREPLSSFFSVRVFFPFASFFQHPFSDYLFFIFFSMSFFPIMMDVLLTKQI